MSPENDPVSVIDILKGIGAALGTVAAGAWAVVNGRLNAHEANHKELATQVREIDTNMVTRDTFHQHETDVYGRLNEMRKEAVGREDRIVSAFRDEFKDLRDKLDRVLEQRSQR